MHGYLFLALIGFAGWLGPKLIKVQEDWLKALVAALSGILVGWLLWHL